MPVVTILERDAPSAAVGQVRPAAHRSGWSPLTAVASLAAGAVHVAAVGAHDARPAVVVFALVAAAQLGWGLAALLRPRARIVAVLAIINGAALLGWAMTKTTGISFVRGLDQAETIQTADGLAAALALVAVLAAVAWRARLGERRSGRPLRLGAVTLLIGALAIPGVATAGEHSHAAGDHHGGSSGAVDLGIYGGGGGHGHGSTG